MSEWQTYKLKDITIKIGSGSTPTGGSGAYKAEGISLIRSQNVLDYKFTEDGLAFIDDDQAYSLRNVIVEANDVLLNITGDSVARCCGAPVNWLPARVNQHVAILRSNPEKLDHRFLKYSLLASKEELLILSEIGGTRNALTKGMLEDYEVILPPLPEQKAIASVLSSLDDKIDLLHRQNKTLEAMAETLFRQWFIEEAKEDWEDAVLGDIATNVRVNATTESIESDEIYIGLEHIERRHIALSQHGIGSDVASNKSRFKKHDILFGKLRPYFHKVCIAPFDGICSTDILVLRAKKEVLITFTLFAFFQDSVVEYANLASGGTRMPRADWGSLSQYPIAIPPVDLLHQFNDLVLPSIEKIHTNLVQIQTLENLRDTLLPKLMSGEVRIQYQTEEVA
ncbi:restriction endonuclease subunit S [Acinetobacter ursingii]|uniref:restriction endonuclease subunit S n=1 Tax=Acinetobacter ursingii TaxID=108980 RepID=UPI00125052C8|nr:restriction endonuclease subunit S [Acinetobacter ursingii]